MFVSIDAKTSKSLSKRLFPGRVIPWIFGNNPAEATSARRNQDFEQIAWNLIFAFYCNATWAYEVAFHYLVSSLCCRCVRARSGFNGTLRIPMFLHIGLGL